MSKQVGTLNGRYAERFSNGDVFILIAGHWYRPIGQESNFIPA